MRDIEQLSSFLTANELPQEPVNYYGPGVRFPFLSHLLLHHLPGLYDVQPSALARLYILYSARRLRLVSNHC